jgi:diketogulonate reductase-like aldo/keto reductase
MRDLRLDRRTLLAASAAAAVAPAVKAQPSILTRAIPKSNQAIPLVGLGSWITFNVGNDPTGRAASTAVMRAFFAAGGRLIDSSPMYGSSQEVIGEGIRKAGNAQRLFAATKVWISGGSNGPTQIEESRRLWTIPKFDLLQVHNLLSWEEHLPTLFAMKAAGKLRYVGVTTSHGRRHDDLERIMRTQPVDFIQVTYNVASREVENRILPLAQERRLVPLLQRSFPQTHVGLELHTKHNAKPVRVVPWAAGELKADYYTPMGSPLAALRPTVDSFPKRAFLKPDPARVRFWQDRLAPAPTSAFAGARC